MKQTEIVELLRNLEAERNAACFHTAAIVEHCRNARDCRARLADLERELALTIGMNRQVAIRLGSQWAMIQTFTRPEDVRIVLFEEVQLQLKDVCDEQASEEPPL